MKQIFFFYLNLFVGIRCILKRRTRYLIYNIIHELWKYFIHEISKEKFHFRYSINFQFTSHKFKTNYFCFQGSDHFSVFRDDKFHGILFPASPKGRRTTSLRCGGTEDAKGKREARHTSFWYSFRPIFTPAPWSLNYWPRRAAPLVEWYPSVMRGVESAAKRAFGDSVEVTRRPRTVSHPQKRGSTTTEIIQANTVY